MKTTTRPDHREEINQSMWVEGIEILGSVTEAYAEILAPGAIRFIVDLSRAFNGRRLELLKMREQRRAQLNGDNYPAFLVETEEIRHRKWKVAPIPEDLEDRRVEITGPVERKMIINALNSGASVFMADFEDSNSPTWDNNVQGQINLRDAVAGTIRFVNPKGKVYTLNEKTATLMVRPRGWHLTEKHIRIDDAPVSASIFDFGLYFYHNAKTLLEKGTGPYFYLPKLESHLEARLWNDVFNLAQDLLKIPRGTIRATVLLETLPAAFEMDEILFELRNHSAGLNCGRWDYIFSFIKTFRNRESFVLPDRATVGMDRHFLHSYVELLIKTCHRRGIHAMGGMAAQIPIKNDPEANEIALEKVRQDKLREVKAGHDGTWVAHPGLVPLAMEIFDEYMKTPNQIDVKRDDVDVSAKDLIVVPDGEITEKGLRHNINVGILYLEAWLRGSGCVPLYNLMEDAATAEISRTQVWQWIRHGKVTRERVKEVIREEVKTMEDLGRLEQATSLFEELMLAETCPEFMTLKAYEVLQ